MDKAGSDPLLASNGKGQGKNEQGQEDSPEAQAKAVAKSKVPKDSGWSWVVVVAAFFLQLIEIGTVKSFGVLYVEFVEKYNAQGGSATWIVALNAFLSMALGPFSTSLGMRFTNRVLVMIGGAFMGLGFLLSAFATSVQMLYLTYGVGVGVGMGLSFAPSIVVVAQYFEKRRALANGIAIAGSGIGNFIIPPIYRFLIGHFGLQGALLVYSGFTLHVCACGALMRPLEFYTKKSKKPSVPEHELSPADPECNGKFTSQRSLNKSSDEDKQSTLRYGLSDMPTHSIQSIADAVMKAEDEEPQEVPEDKPKSCLTRWYLRLCFTKGPGGQVQPMFDWSLFKVLSFHVYLWAAFCSSLGYPVVFVMLPPGVMDAGATKIQAAILVSVVGISDLLGRIVFGWFSDLQIIKRKYGFFIAMVLSGITCILFPLLMFSFELTIMVCILFGLFGGSYIALMPVMLVEAVGPQLLPNAYGLVVLGQGIAMLISIPTMGYMRAATGTWKYSFFLCATTILLGSTFFFLKPIVRRCCTPKTSPDLNLNEDNQLPLTQNGNHKNSEESGDVNA